MVRLKPLAQLAWPLPALVAWSLAWLTFIALPRLGAPAWLALVLAVALGVALALPQSTRSRRVMVAAGFPASLLASGMAIGLPAWAWLLPLGLLATAYPHRAWSDAPLYPTPEHSLDDLPPLAPVADGARVLDAGCGLGHGLRALRRAYPQARIEGIEWSWPLALLTRLSCPWARVSRGDMWAQSWQPFALVYLFQRPETMARAWAKAQAELAPGAWLVSLEFEITGLQPTAHLQTKSGKNVCLYQVPYAHPT